jgi:hypothetical protein
MEHNTIQELFKAYGVTKDTERVKCEDVHVLLPIEKVNELMDKYVLTCFPGDCFYYYLIPKEG